MAEENGVEVVLARPKKTAAATAARMVKPPDDQILRSRSLGSVKAWKRTLVDAARKVASGEYTASQGNAIGKLADIWQKARTLEIEHRELREAQQQAAKQRAAK